jgi:23S rRNA pseudouridine2605 synthase
VRTAIGEVKLGNQRPGKVRPLTVSEVGGLYKAGGL